MSEYFSHDYSARIDPKILELRAEYGWEGYGVFWAFIEHLADNDGMINEDHLGGVSLGLGLSKEWLINWLEVCYRLELLKKDKEGNIYSDRLNEHFEKRQKLRDSGKIGAVKTNKSKTTNPATPAATPPATPKGARSHPVREAEATPSATPSATPAATPAATPSAYKGKESKVKERKEKKNIKKKDIKILKHQNPKNNLFKEYLTDVATNVTKASKVKKNKHIPDISEFLKTGKEKCEKAGLPFAHYKFSIQEKYNAWRDNNWRDGYNKPIKNWRNKLGNTLPYMKPTNKDKPIPPKIHTKKYHR